MKQENLIDKETKADYKNWVPKRLLKVLYVLFYSSYLAQVLSFFKEGKGLSGELFWDLQS